MKSVQNPAPALTSGRGLTPERLPQTQRSLGRFFAKNGIMPQVLNLCGIHYLVTRFGWRSIRARAFDARYQKRRWVFDGYQESELADAIRPYLGGGELLLMGCGGASILEALTKDLVTRVVGVDLSKVALLIARKFESDGVSFVHGDMLKVRYTGRFDVILFSESLYYCRPFQQYALLRRLVPHLKKDGVFVVTLANLRRHTNLVERLRREFDVVESRKLGMSDRWLVVCRPESAKS